MGVIERDLRTLLRGDVEFDPVSRHLYATDAGLSQIEPLGVVSPRDGEDVQRLVSYACDRGLSLIPRGAGSGLAGGAVGAGIQVDFTRHMTRVLEVAEDGSWARVQPGVIMAELNRLVKAQERFFAPDPSSENYCSLGGMIGTNSSGARSVAYGGTKDHVLRLDVVLADGSLMRVGPLTDGSRDCQSLVEGSGTGSRAFATVVPLLRNESASIAASMPRVVKNCSGYRIETVLEKTANGGERLNLQRLFVGAEGTLGLITEATLKLAPLPPMRGVAMVYFPSVFSCGQAVPGILALQPSAVEIMDSRFLSLVRKHDKQMNAMMPPRTDTALLIEFEGRDRAELHDRFEALRRHLDGSAALQLTRAANDEETERLWRVRKSAVAMALRVPGPRRPLPFIEDVTVHPDEVPGYIDFLQKLLDYHGVEAMMYGHVGDGNIHTRPMLDPKDQHDIATMESIYHSVSEYVRSVRGTMSGEHGDGLLRSPYVRDAYGDHIYEIFSRVKAAFDPQSILNPGKKVLDAADARPLRDNVRFGAFYTTQQQRSLLEYGDSTLELEIEKCHGCAQCKSVVATTMCPVYKATRKEHASPRGKANLLRGVIAGRLDLGDPSVRQSAQAVIDKCLLCGMCAVECPSGVNVAKLMLEAKHKHRAIQRGSPVEFILGHLEQAYQLGQRVAPLTNSLINRSLLRRLAEPLLGLDHRRPMPKFSRFTFNDVLVRRLAGAESQANQQGPVIHQSGAGAVAYFYDILAMYNEPTLALIVEAILKAHGVQVLYPPQKASGIPEMMYGYTRRARSIATFNVSSALPFAEEGATVLCSEPSTTYAFKVHYSDFVKGFACSTVANATADFSEYLVRVRSAHPEDAPKARHVFNTRSDRVRVAYHLPCHLKAQCVGNPTWDLICEIPGLEVINLDAGCCGMMGTSGMKASAYDSSMLIGRPLFEGIREAQPSLILSECTACRMQIAKATGIHVAHPARLLAAAYRVSSPRRNINRRLSTDVPL